MQLIEKVIKSTNLVEKVFKIRRCVLKNVKLNDLKKKEY